MGVREDFFRALQACDLQHEAYVLSLANSLLTLWVRVGSAEAAQLAEAQHRGKPIGGPYSARLDRPPSPKQLPDLHVFVKDRELFAMYSDGTRKHGRPGFRIPNRVAAGIRQHFPDFQIPDDQILEVSYELGLPPLREEASNGS